MALGRGLSPMPGTIGSQNPRLSLRISAPIARPRRQTADFGCRALLSDPWKTLGVSHSAGEAEIKKAHRSLVKQHHPDVTRDDPVAQARFIAVQEAYEIIIGKRRGKEVDTAPQPDSWQFHDWFWKFSMSRRQRKEGGAAGAAPPPEALRHQWKAQMAGLRQKAAAKRAAGSDGQPAAAAREEAPKRDTSSVWRSTTKNARRPPAQPSAAAAADTVGAGSRAAAEARLHAAASSDGAASRAASQPASQQAAAPAAPAQAASAPQHEEPAAAQQHGRPPLHEVLSHALHRHEGAVHAHTARLASSIVALSQQLSQQLRERLLPSLQLPSLRAVRVPPLVFGFHGRPSAAQAELHLLFGDEVRGREQPPAEEQQPVGAAACEGAQQGAGYRQAPRFANSSDVRDRCKLQLAGLRRRAALKEELARE